ncbi:ABC transporter permease [Afipia sp. P52-10]|uniref:branched-chain amino acid ABC transporter permease n=1 Tax=Afipia sp. P52-10 TaxID=1429916 RepID=UPI0003DF127B|nr:branched-chain amino acid ABC transporter permease [Afipia sp. P52-10]ETR78075.1 ABC transporter permease [Afipia sp. P52-10]
MIRSLLVISIFAAAALVAGAVLDPRGYIVRVVCLMLLAASLGQCWNIVGGLANQISLGHAAFFGIGAYTTTILQIRYGISPWIGLFLGAAIAGLVGFLISIPTMRLKGSYFALATLAFGEACRIFATAAAGLTGGPQGISVPFVGNSWAMMQFRGAGPYVPILVGLFILISVIFVVLSNGKLGYLLRATRESEDAAEVAGVNTLGVKLAGSTISAALTAVVGTMFVQFNFFIDPDIVFNPTSVSIRAALITIVGGVGILTGPIFGAIAIVTMEEVLSAYLSNQAAGVAPLIFGGLLIAIVLWKPAGLSAISFSRKRALS